ncbi:YeeE/YedE family protein [soil metagenome]
MTYSNPPDFECLDAEQVLPEDQDKALTEGNRPLALFVYGLIGVYLGFVFVQSEVVSWFRIQEMFRFQSFHMYGVIGSAVAVAALSVYLIQRFGARTLHGARIRVTPKDWGDSSIPGARYWMGGTLFGLGWALLGACPGPIFALIGVGAAAPATGLTVMFVALLAAMAGTWVYAALRVRLPH